MKRLSTVHVPLLLRLRDVCDLEAVDAAHANQARRAALHRVLK